MPLVEQGKLDLDTPIRDDLDKPLPSYGPDPVFPNKYGPYKDLADDPRWEKITPRMCLTLDWLSQHLVLRSGPEAHPFQSGTRSSYLGEDFILLQFVIEHGHKALGLDVGELAKANFDRLGMTRPSLVWRDFYKGHVYFGYGARSDLGMWHGWLFAYDATNAQTECRSLSNAERCWSRDLGVGCLHAH